jgi:hypothetical protein
MPIAEPCGDNCSELGWSQAQVQGFTIAAVIADDPRAVQASAGLAPAVADAVTVLAQELAACDPETRRQRIRSLTALLNPALPDAPLLTARAQALLARAVPKRVGRIWLQKAPPPRLGFRPETLLIRLLKRIALLKANRTSK